jgi:hypothetical protein
MRNLFTSAFTLLRTPVLSLGLPLCLTLAACSTTQPIPYAGVAASPQMRPTQGEAAEHMPYEYKTTVNWEKYTAVMVEPVEIYHGDDGQFEGVSEEDKAYLARAMQTEFAEKLAARFKRVATPGNDTLRIKLTLTGAKGNTAVLATLSRFDLMGGPYNAVQEVRGKQGALSGSVSFEVEIYNASSNALLAAYVSKQYPSPWNLKATIGAMSASVAGIESGAEQLVTYLR